ncbi:MAG: YeeE/YedE family protein [Myxococcota bacterium]|nr:YeeE/YedE family protein [Myxococcota bacterium]
MKRTDLVAFAAGLLFAIGLGISGMTQPAKVIAFLDVTGAWDPSLAFVMLGAIGVHHVFARRTDSGAAPRFVPAFFLPRTAGIDRRLLLGAALFGIGWGIAGFCPGPAVVSVVTLAPTPLAFVAAMLVGMGAYAFVFEHATPRSKAKPACRPASLQCPGALTSKPDKERF